MNTHVSAHTPPLPDTHRHFIKPAVGTVSNPRKRDGAALLKSKGRKKGKREKNYNHLNF